MFLALKEKRFIKAMAKRLLASYKEISRRRPELSGETLYREVLLYSKLADADHITQLLWEADDSLDAWTTQSITKLSFRDVVHFVVLEQYLANDHAATVVSVRDIVYALIPADL